jgi:uncharacterized protein YjbI with pentapeptide repeats
MFQDFENRAFQKRARINFKDLMGITTGEWESMTVAQKIDVARRKKWEIDFRGEDLRSLDFYGANLSGYDFSVPEGYKPTNFSYADLRQANLSETNFPYEVARRGARIDYQALMSLDSHHYYGEGEDGRLVGRINFWVGQRPYKGVIDFSGLNLRGRCLSGACLYAAVLIGTDFSGADLQDTYLRRAVLDNNTVRAKLGGTKINRATLKTLNTREWKGQSLKKKIELWELRGGIVVDE